MKNWLVSSIAICLSLSFGNAYSQSLAEKDKDARAAHKPIKAQKIILVGDSTTQVLSGWGGEFCASHLVSSVACINLARGGRSSFSYKAEGSWEIALGEMGNKNFAKTYVLIQFGHNDMPGKPGRSTDLETEFPDFILQYIKDVRAKGAIPVLLTPLTRRSFKNGVLKNDLIPWAEKIRNVAIAQNVPLIDLNEMSAKAVQDLGPVESIKFAQLAPSKDIIDAANFGTTIDAPKPQPISQNNCIQAPSTANCENFAKPSGTPNGKANLNFDYTHLGHDGAVYFSKMVASGLAAAVPELSDYIIP